MIDIMKKFNIPPNHWFEYFKHFKYQCDIGSKYFKVLILSVCFYTEKADDKLIDLISEN